MIRIERFIRELSEQQWLDELPITDWVIHATEYILPGEYSPERPFAGSESFDLYPSRQGTTYMMRSTLSIPTHWSHNSVGLLFTAGTGEGLLRINGKSWQGLDRNHTYVTMPSQLGEKLELEIELFDVIPEPIDPLNQQANVQSPIRKITSSLVHVNEFVQSLMYTVTVIRDAVVLLPETDLRRVRLIEALHAAMDAFNTLSSEQIVSGGPSAIEQQLVERVKGIGGHSEGLIHMVGQSHIDVAWLWPCRETVRKTSRTFSTVDALMREYPEYRYAQSQPLLFEYVKKNDPELYERIKARVREGRWELVGGMWVEPDLNIPSGESLIRQMLYGQRFYEQEFGKRSIIEWLPDTFGYCASLPQILKHGGIQYFMTTKLNWNDTNTFPYDLFNWVGIDGTPMLSYLNHGLNEHTKPKDIDEHWQSYRAKAIHPEQMLLYGHGDGGGGVTREMLEGIDRSNLMVGQPASQYSSAEDFFKGITEANLDLPAWHGDLYLELHRGTYTTHGRNKRSNRKAEILYREAEVWWSLALSVLSHDKSAEVKQSLHEGWKLILLNQFHDIIPGSAITETYETSLKEYEEVFERGMMGLHTGTEAIAACIQVDVADAASNAAEIPYVVFNSLGWKRDCTLELTEQELAGHGIAISEETSLSIETAEGELIKYELGYKNEEKLLRICVPQVPAFGYRTMIISEKSVAEAATVVTTTTTQSLSDTWETAFYRIKFNEQGEIISLYDKLAQREIVKLGERANRFHFFHDRPVIWDAWDIDPRYEQQLAGEAVLMERKVISTGDVSDVLGFRWQLGQSVIEQELVLYHQHGRIDFRTKVDWQESHKLLKVGFPLDIMTNKATYEIPFGALERNTHRNTSWDQAQFEVCGHRFADLSEHGYGVSLLNDCKYGYDALNSTIRLSLLRAPKWPDRTADLGIHEFTYALLPHEGDWREAHTVRAATELNHQPTYMKVNASIVNNRTDSSQEVWSPTRSLLPISSEHVIIDTIKPAEDSDGIIIRMYESAGGRETIELPWLDSSAEAYISNAMEEEIEALDHLALTFAPYEIKTIKLK